MSLKAQVEELEEVKRRNVCLEKEKLKYDACLEELKREKDERMKELFKNEVMKRVKLRTQFVIFSNSSSRALSWASI